MASTQMALTLSNGQALANGEQVSLAELVSLCAIDNDLYAHTFFPKTARQESPPFHRLMDEMLDGPARYVAFEVFRGAAKTTKVRLFLSKRIAYGLARTIVVVGKSQDHAIKTVQWLKTQVEWNTRWAQTFGLRRGKKWSDVECQIIHGVEEVPVHVVALGITGSTRGINIEDYRPDLILVDDPSDEENTATEEQREKTDDFINGSLRNSLAPASEAPYAKMMFTQTLLNSNDSISRCEKDPIWAFLKISCFDERGESVWPQRFPTATLMAEKESYIARGKLHLWMREMECQIAPKELAAFQVPIEFYDLMPDDPGIKYYMAIDPVPPPSEREMAKGLKGKDWEVLAVVGKWGRRLFLAEYVKNQGHSPDWTLGEFFRLKRKYNPLRCRVESIAYQRTLKWLIEQAMKRRGEWMVVDDTSGDKRAKQYRIIDVIGSVVADRRLFVHRSMSEFIEQYQMYPNVEHDDVIEAVAIAIKSALGYGDVFEGEYSDITEQEKDIPDLVLLGGCP